MAGGFVTGLADVQTESEPERVARARGGDAGAFESLYREHVGRVYGLCLRMTGQPATAEDLTQDTFVSAWRSLPGYEGRSSFSTWLHRIAVNAALEQLRRRGRVETALPDGEEAEGLLARTLEAQPGPERVARSAELRRGIEGELARMSVLERSAFVLRHHEGRSLEDIAAALSLNVGACKQAIFRAVRKLRAVLEPELP
jgi:RNA polymerase sigma-70 factor (ECF subfamily)